MREEGEGRGPGSPGEGVPRESGGERDSFLRRSAEARDGMRERDTTARLVGGGGAAATAALLTAARDRKSSNESGYASLHNAAPTPPSSNNNSNGNSTNTNPSRHIIPPDVLIRMYDSDSSDHDHDHEPQADSPLLPPRTLDPDNLGLQRQPDNLGPLGLARQRPTEKSSATSLHSARSERSVTPGNEPEGATVHTARRVRLERLENTQPRALSPIDDNPHSRDNSEGGAGPSAWGRVVGLAGLSKRLSWLNRSPSPPHGNGGSSSRSPPRTPRSPTRPTSFVGIANNNNTRPTSFAGRGLADRDLESGRALLESGSGSGGGRAGGLLRAEMGYRLGEGSRPISTVSSGNKSGGSGNGGGGSTVYHSASSRPSTDPSTSVPPVPANTQNTKTSAGSKPSMGGRSGSSTGNTVFHDAYSRPGTPYYTPAPNTPISPAPVVVSSVGSRGTQGTQFSGSQQGRVPEGDPPAYDAGVGVGGGAGQGQRPPTVYVTPTTEFPPGTDIDILDMPAPRPEPPFTSASSSAGHASYSASGRASTSASGPGRPTSLPPPGLPVPQVWKDAASSGAENSGSGGSGSSRESPDSGLVRVGGVGVGGGGGGAGIDVLEEAPPAAGEGWRTLSRMAVDGQQGRRATFGVVSLSYSYS